MMKKWKYEGKENDNWGDEKIEICGNVKVNKNGMENYNMKERKIITETMKKWIYNKKNKEDWMKKWKYEGKKTRLNEKKQEIMKSYKKKNKKENNTKLGKSKKNETRTLKFQEPKLRTAKKGKKTTRKMKEDKEWWKRWKKRQSDESIVEKRENGNPRWKPKQDKGRRNGWGTKHIRNNR